MQSMQAAVGAAPGLWPLPAEASAHCAAAGLSLPEFLLPWSKRRHPAQMRSMTVEEFAGCRMEMVENALEEVLCKAVLQRSLTVGVLEAAKLLNVDPDNVVLCLLAADEDDNQDVALQIHFTLIQAFCCENDISILRVSNVGRLEAILGSSGREDPGGDLHCVLVNNPHASQWTDPALNQVICFCQESRYLDQWVPVIHLPDR